MIKALMKKVIITVTFLGIGISGVSADTQSKMPLGLEFIGQLDTVYKNQSDYRNPMDSKDPLIAAGFDKSKGFDQRDGANNRSSQNVRTEGSLTMIAKGIENTTENGGKWYGLIGVMKLKMTPNDPDYVSEEKLDGTYKDKVDLGDVWLRYAPARMVGIKVGVQTVAATATAAGIGHKFAGDLDEDFIYYTSGVLTAKPGLTVDVHLAKNISLGIGQLQGMGDLSSLVVGGSSSQAKNNVAWFKGGFGLVDLTVGYQNIAVGGTETDSEGIQGKWLHKYSHSLLNWTAKLNFGNISPFIAQQAISGDKTSDGASFVSYDKAMKSLAALGTKRLNNRGGDRTVELSMITMGVIAGLGEYGKIAAEYTTAASPEWGESKNAAVATELASSMQINYEYPLSEYASITFFYNTLTSKKDSKLRDDIATATANNAKIDTAAGMNLITSTQAASLKQLADSLDIYKWSGTHSMGIALNIKFGK